jgi:hypothetical protein
MAAVQQMPVLFVTLLKCVFYLLFRNKFVTDWWVRGPEQHVGVLVINYSIFVSSCYHCIFIREHPGLKMPLQYKSLPESFITGYVYHLTGLPAW